MSALAIDTETTTFNFGNCYDARNRCACYSYADGTEQGAVQIDAGSIESLCARIRRATVLIFFNAKFDLAWLRKLGIDYSGKVIFDTQAAEFILERQRIRFPSLEDTSVKYGLGNKIDVIKEKYWNNGIDTADIPWDELSEYATQDAVLTYKVYQQQINEFAKRDIKLYKLFKLMMHDLLILQEMEWNGLKYDPILCEERSNDLEKEILEINTRLSAIYPDVPINFGSGDQLSAFLYGGTIVEERRVPIGFWKSGKKKDEPRYKVEEVNHVMPRLASPLKGSALKKEGFFKTDADTLTKLSCNKKVRSILDMILRLGKIDKLNGTYYKGIPKLCEKMNWEQDMIHGQFNQVVAQTGRLSAVQPNQQNLDPGFQQCIVSRYDY